MLVLKSVGRSLTMNLSFLSCIYERGVVIIATIGIRLSPQDKHALAVIAVKTDTTVSQILRKLIREYIQEENKDE